MYLAHPKHLLSIIRVAMNLKIKSKFVLNLFWGHFIFFNNGSLTGFVDESIIEIFNKTRKLRNELNINLCVDTMQLQAGIFCQIKEKLLDFFLFKN